jgi:hypothetical protein
VSAAPRGRNEKVRRVCICFSLICVLIDPCSFPATLRKQNRPFSRPSRARSLLHGGETEGTMIDKDSAAEAIRNIEDQFQKIDSASEWASFYQVHNPETPTCVFAFISFHRPGLIFCPLRTQISASSHLLVALGGAPFGAQLSRAAFQFYRSCRAFFRR